VNGRSRMKRNHWYLLASPTYGRISSKVSIFGGSLPSSTFVDSTMTVIVVVSGKNGNNARDSLKCLSQLTAKERSSSISGIHAMWTLQWDSVGWNIRRSGNRERNTWCDNETRRLGIIMPLMNRADLHLYVMTSRKRKLNNRKKQKTVITAANATTHITASLSLYLITIFLC